MTGYDPLGSAGSAGGDGGGARVEPRLRLAAPVTGPEEIAAVTEVLGSGILTNGPWTRRFEERMAERHDSAHGVAMANGTVALAAMLLATGIGPGDEVIVPSLTFIGTATAVSHVGATPVFADVDDATLCLDPDDVERRIGPRTKAIMPVHYAGQPAPMDRFVTLAERHGLVLLEDSAQAHGASLHGRAAGAWGVAGMFSFTPTKNITTGEGAVVTTSDGDLAHQLRLLRNHGMSAPYQHDVLGYNWRLSELQSAMGCCQMDRLDPILEIKAANAAHLADLLADVDGVDAPVVRPGAVHPFMICSVRVRNGRRDAAAAALAAAGIETRIYFPPAHRQPIFDAAEVDLPVTDHAVTEILSLPCHTQVTPHDREDMVAILQAAATP